MHLSVRFSVEEETVKIGHVFRETMRNSSPQWQAAGGVRVPAAAYYKKLHDYDWSIVLIEWAVSTKWEPRFKVPCD